MDTLPLELFNEKVVRLEKSNLAVRMANPHYKLQYERIINREWIAADGITPDDVDAFILNLRLLLQDRDGFSIRCLSEIYGQSGVSMEYRNQFDARRAKLNIHWAHPSVIGKPDHSGNYTNKELFDIIVYGGLAHCDPTFLHEFRLLTSLGFFSAMVFAAFHHTLQVVLSVVKNIRDLNTEVIRGISQQSLATLNSAPQGCREVANSRLKSSPSASSNRWARGPRPRETPGALREPILHRLARRRAAAAGGRRVLGEPLAQRAGSGCRRRRAAERARRKCQ